MPNCDLPPAVVNGSVQRLTPASSEERTEVDNVTSIELQRNRRLLYFSDGTMEELSDSSDNEADIDVPDKSLDLNINENELPLMPRFKYRASKVGTNILAGIDYIGGGLASLLGITTPKYASEMASYQRSVDTASAANTEEAANDTWRRGTTPGDDDGSVHLNQVITKGPQRA